MNIDKTSSERLQLLRFPLIYGVILIHTNKAGIYLANGEVGGVKSSYINTFIINYISLGLADVALPLFYLMAGYFFFLNSSFSLATYKKKLVSRSKTLVIPFLFWNCITLIITAIGQHFAATQSFFSGKNLLIAKYGAFDYLNAIIGITTFPISYQFWFIRDLIVLVLFSPVIFLILRSLPKLSFVGLFMLWYFQVWPITIPAIIAVSFFYFGAFFAFFKINLFSLDYLGKYITILYLLILIFDTHIKMLPINHYIHSIGIIFGIISAIFLTKIIMNHSKAKQYLLWLSGFSFFIFAVHEPLLTIFQKLLYKLLVPSSDLMIFTLYLLNPILVVAISILLYKCLQSLSPRFTSIISGGR